MQIYEKNHKRLTYVPHSAGGWYLGPAVKHYICYTYYNIDTGEENKLDTIAFFLAFMKMTNYSTRDMAIYSTADLAKDLQIPSPESPFQVGDAQLKAIRELSQIFMQRLKYQTGMHCPPPQTR